MLDELAGDRAHDEPASFEGTRWECMAFLDSFFSLQRWITEGALESALSKGDAEMADGYRGILDALEGRVYRVTVESLGKNTETPVRPENAQRVMRVQTAIELFDIITRANKNTGDDNADA